MTRTTWFRAALGLSLLCSAAGASGEPAAPPRGDVVAGAEGVRYALPGGAVIRLAPGSRARFTGAIPIKLGTAGQPGTRTWTLRLAAGRADVSVPAAEPPTTAVLVRLPRNISAIAKDGSAVVAADAGQVTAAATGGDMLVAVGDAWKPLSAGMERTFAVGETGTPRAILGAPALETPPGPALAVAEERASVPIAWKKVDGASAYSVTVYAEDGRARHRIRRLRTRDTHAVVDQLAAGRYSATIQAVDRYTIEGAPSKPVGLRVIGVELPPGAYVSGGSVQLGRRDEARFVGVEGLEASYGKARVFVPAPSHIGVHGGEPLLVRFRQHGSTREAKIRLEPRDIQAQISISPRAARWPADRVKVKIRLLDSHGHAAPGRIQAVPTVLIDVDPVKVQWTRRGRELEGVVPPPARPGPWVVRVEVADQYGEALGRDFLEVAPEEQRTARR